MAIRPASETDVLTAVIEPARQVELEHLAAFAREHGNPARIVGERVEVESQEHNINTGHWSTVTDHVGTMAELRAVLGY